MKLLITLSLTVGALAGCTSSMISELLGFETDYAIELDTSQGNTITFDKRLYTDGAIKQDATIMCQTYDTGNEAVLIQTERTGSTNLVSQTFICVPKATTGTGTETY